MKQETAIQYQKRQIERIRKALKRLETRCEIFHAANENTWFEDLASVANDLENADKFISNKYLKTIA